MPGEFRLMDHCTSPRAWAAPEAMRAARARPAAAAFATHGEAVVVMVSLLEVGQAWQALPLVPPSRTLAQGDGLRPAFSRSEERRVGEEGRSRWSPYH